MVCKHNVPLVGQEHFHIMEHHVKHVLMEATVLKEQQSVLSVHQDISKCD